MKLLLLLAAVMTQLPLISSWSVVPKCSGARKNIEENSPVPFAFPSVSARPPKLVEAFSTVATGAVVTIITYTIPLSAEAMITRDDMAQVEEIVRISQMKMQSEMEKQLKEQLQSQQVLVQEQLQSQQSKIESKMQEMKRDLGTYPLLTAGIGLFTSAVMSTVTMGVAQNSNQNFSNKVDDSLKRFDESREGIKKELEENTSSRTFAASLSGGVIGVLFLFVVMSTVTGMAPLEHVPHLP